MFPLSYKRAAGIDEALALGSAAASAFYAGGTNLVDLMRLHVVSPQSVVDINHLPLAAIEFTPPALRLGALARMSDTADHSGVRTHAPAIAQALEESASGQLRNMATLGGNVLQRTRCPYFRDVATACNKREPGSGCGALQGINDEHAILGTSDACIAVHPSDFAVPLVAFGAAVVLRSTSGSRMVRLEQFFLTPGDTPDRETVLEPGELIAGIDVPVSAVTENSVYIKARERTSFAFALASCAAGVERAADGSIVDVRIALGGVATVPWRARAAEDLLRGKLPNPTLFAAAARAAFADARPTSQNLYKMDLGIATIVRALEAVTA